MKKIIILIFALVFSLFIPSAFAFSQAETLEYYQDNYYTITLNSTEVTTVDILTDFEIELINSDIYFDNTLVFSSNQYVENEYFLSGDSAYVAHRKITLYGTASFSFPAFSIEETTDPLKLVITIIRASAFGEITIVDKNNIIPFPTFAESIFSNITDIIIGFGSLLGALFVLIASIFYNESLTIVGILALLGVGLSLTYWGFRTVLRLLKIKRE